MHAEDAVLTRRAGDVRPCGDEEVRAHRQPRPQGWVGAQSSAMVAADQANPNPAGHRHVATDLAADLKDLRLNLVSSS